MTPQESLDVATYISRASKTRQDIEHAGGTLHIELLPIFGLTRQALLAIRYRLKDGNVRKAL